MPSTPAGWYGSPERKEMLQWWDGAAWQQQFEDRPEWPKKCPNCGEYAVQQVKGWQANESTVGALLFLFGLLPGGIYYWYVTKAPFCVHCLTRVRDFTAKDRLEALRH